MRIHIPCLEVRDQTRMPQGPHIVQPNHHPRFHGALPSPATPYLSLVMSRKAVRVRSSALWTEAGPTGYGYRVDVFLPSQPLGSDAAGAKAGPTAPDPSGRWRWEVGSCRVAGGDGTFAKVDFGAPRRRRPRTPAPPKPPKRCTYQRPGSRPCPPLARRAGRGGGGEHQAVGLRTGAAAGALRRGRRTLRS